MAIHPDHRKFIKTMSLKQQQKENTPAASTNMASTYVGNTPHVTIINYNSHFKPSPTDSLSEPEIATPAAARTPPFRNPEKPKTDSINYGHYIKEANCSTAEFPASILKLHQEAFIHNKTPREIHDLIQANYDEWTYHLNLLRIGMNGALKVVGLPTEKDYDEDETIAPFEKKQKITE